MKQGKKCLHYNERYKHAEENKQSRLKDRLFPPYSFHTQTSNKHMTPKKTFKFNNIKEEGQTNHIQTLLEFRPISSVRFPTCLITAGLSLYPSKNHTSSFSRTKDWPELNSRGVIGSNQNNSTSIKSIRASQNQLHVS